MVRINLGSKLGASPLATLALVVLASVTLGGCSFDNPLGSSSGTADAAAAADKGRRGTVQVAPINHAPTIAGTPPATAQAGQAYSFTPTAGDQDGQALTFTIANKPGWLAFNTATGAITGTPAASDVQLWANITISVSDGAKAASLSPFPITVAAAPLPPPPPVASTGSATLSWVAPSTNTDNSTLTDLAGFRVYYGKAANTLDQIIRVTNPTVTQQVVDNLVSGTWYFAVTAVSSTGAESSLSAVASKTFP
jgi:hypothetical protein